MSREEGRDRNRESDRADGNVDTLYISQTDDDHPRRGGGMYANVRVVTGDEFWLRRNHNTDCYSGRLKAKLSCTPRNIFAFLSRQVFFPGYNGDFRGYTTSIPRYALHLYYDDNSGKLTNITLDFLYHERGV